MGNTTSPSDEMFNDYVFEKSLPNNHNSIVKHKKTGAVFLLRQISMTSEQ